MPKKLPIKVLKKHLKNICIKDSHLDNKNKQKQQQQIDQNLDNLEEKKDVQMEESVAELDKSKAEDDCQFEKACLINFEFTHENGLTPEQYAFIRQDTEFLKMLWRQGCPFKDPTFGLAKLQLCTKRKSNLTKSDLLNSKIFITQEEKELVSAQKDFFFGVKNNNANQVINALKKGAEPRCISKEVQYPLHYLAKQGYYKVMKVLLNRGVPANTYNLDHETPLDVAVSLRDLEMCKLLLQYGACYHTVVIRKKNVVVLGKVAFAIVNKNNIFDHKEPIRRFSNLKLLFQAIVSAFKSVRSGDQSIVSILRNYIECNFLSEYHILVNCVDSRGRTLMGLAIDKGHWHLAESLMKIRMEVDKN